LITRRWWWVHFLSCLVRRWWRGRRLEDSPPPSVCLKALLSATHLRTLENNDAGARANGYSILTQRRHASVGHHSSCTHRSLTASGVSNSSKQSPFITDSCCCCCCCSCCKHDSVRDWLSHCSASAPSQRPPQPPLQSSRYTTSLPLESNTCTYRV
jgi:hypothetical protein